MRIGLIPEDGMKYPSHLGRHGRETETVLPQALLAAACLAFVLWKRK
jgi:hypothetical protein